MSSKYDRHFGYKLSHFGQDTYGHDVKAFGNTTGKYAFWDASTNTLNLIGTFTQTGNQTITGDLTLTGNSLLKGTFGTGTGGTAFTVAADGALAIATDKLTVSAAGAVVAASTVKSTGDLTVGDSKFVVTAASGNTLLKGTLGAGTNGTTFTVAADGALAIATNKFTVSAAGIVTAAGKVTIAGGLAQGLYVGSDSNTAGSGCALTAANYQGNGFFADDGGAALTTGYTECLTARYLIATAVTGGAGADVSTAAFHGDMHVRANYTGMGGLGGIWGQFSVPTGVTIDTSAGIGDVQGGHFTVDIPSGATLAASSYAAAVSVGGNLGGTITGTVAGFRVRAPSAGSWDYAFLVHGLAAADCSHGIFIGEDSNSSGSAIPLSASSYCANALYADDGGVALTSGYTEAFTARYLVSTAVTGGAGADVSAAAIHADMHVRANYTGMGGMSGIWGAFSVPTGVTIDNSASSMADVAGGHFGIDIPSGATLAASSDAAGVSVGGNLGGTISGLATAFRIRTPSAGSWSAALSIAGNNGAYQASAATGGTSQYLKVYISDVLYTVEMTTAA